MMARRTGRKGKEWYRQLVWVALVLFLAVAAITATLKTKLLERDSLRYGLRYGLPQGLEVNLANLSSERSTNSTAVKTGIDDPLGSEWRSGSVEGLFCDRSHPRTDVCTLKGDVRMNGQTASFILYTTDPDTQIREERIKPYTRKWEKSCMDTIHDVKLKSMSHVHNNSPLCEIQHTVPAVVFSTGGYTGNLYHEFHDGLIPLFITSQHLKREVIFVIVEFHDWWLMKYSDVIKQLSNYPVVDLEKETQIYCFPEVIVGLHIHDELGIDPSLMPGYETIRDFRAVLDRAYTELSVARALLPVIRKPKLVILVRDGTRVFENLDEIVGLAEEVGYNVTLLKPDPTTELKRLYRMLNCSEVLMGVHGAALTHFLFMRPGSVFIQVVPLGTTWAASDYYGNPAKKLGLQYIEYIIKPEESSLSDQYDRNDTRLTNPEALVKKSWWEMKEIYLEHQDVRLSLTRFRRTLMKAKLKALHFIKSQKNAAH